MTKAGKTALAWGAVALGAAAAVVAIFWPRSASASEGGSMIPSVAEVQNIIRRVMAGSQIPVWFALAVAELESGFGRAPRGDRGRSFGVFHIFFPIHKENLSRIGVTSGEQLDDVELSATFWRDEIAGVFARAVGATPDDPASWERVRLRLAGAGGRDGTPDNASDEARLARYRPVAEKWRAREAG